MDITQPAKSLEVDSRNRSKYKRNYYVKNRDSILAKEKERYRKPGARERKYNYDVKYREKNKEKIADKQKKYRQENVEKRKSYLLVRDFGITLEDMNKMVADQGGKCAICGEKLDRAKNTHVDHDHKTGKVRGILCAHCNRALGCIKDNPVIALRIAEYLKKEW